MAVPLACAGFVLLAACGSENPGSEWPSGGPSVDSTDGHAGDHVDLEPADVMGRPDRVIQGPQGNEGQFVVECEFSHSASDDPILFPGQPGASHLHAFFGNESTSATSTLENLLDAPTTCDDRRDTAAYWVPVLVDGGEVIEPTYAVAYYRAGIDMDPRTVVAYPPGLRVIAGDPMATDDQPVEVVAWGCGQGGRTSAVPPMCPTGVDVRLTVTFPDCWDGRNLGSPGHRRHMRYSTAGECPSSHPVPVPQLVLAVHYPVDGDPTRLRLSSGGPETGHADFFNSWEQEHLEQEVDVCIRRQNVCSVSSGRRPV